MNGHATTHTKIYMTQPKNIIKKNATMAFYNLKEQLFLETDMLGVGLGARLLHMRDGMQFPRNKACSNAALWPISFTSKSLIRAETCYNNIEREVLAMPHGLKIFHHYCFTHEVSMTTNWKLLVVIIKTDVANL